MERTNLFEALFIYLFEANLIFEPWDEFAIIDNIDSI